MVASIDTRDVGQVNLREDASKAMGGKERLMGSHDDETMRNNEGTFGSL
jgi:hypothetical protein